MPPKKTPRRRGVSTKKPNKNQPTVPPSPVASIEPIEEPIVEPPEEEPQKKVKSLSFPFDDLSERHHASLYGTMKVVKKAVTGVLDRHNVRCTIPVDEMDGITKSIEKLVAYRKMKGGGPVLEAPFDEAFAQLSEEHAGVEKSVLRQELLKYTLIASSKLDKMSTGTLLSIVSDLDNRFINLGEYEEGYPAKVAAPISNFYGITDKEFKALTEHNQMKLEKQYVKEKIGHCEEVKKFLNEKHERLMEEGREEELIDPWTDWPEGKIEEDKLTESFKKTREEERLLRFEYSNLKSKEEEAEVNQYRADFRAMHLRGREGPFTKEEEEQIDRDFYQSAFRTIKVAVDEWKKGKEEEVDENAMEIE